jgi:hypothetical protein
MFDSQQICNSIYSCQRTFLEQQERKDGPWEHDLPTKTLFDSLTDVLADIPGLIERVIRNTSLSEVLFANIQAENSVLQMQLLGLLQNLGTLHDAWKTKYPTAKWPVKRESRPKMKKADMISPIPPFDDVFYFEDMRRANDFCIYKVALILTLLFLQEVAGPQVVNSVLLKTFPNNPSYSIQSLASFICRSAEYLTLDIHNSRGYIIFTFPVTIAYMVLDKNSPEASYLYDMCSLNADSSGYGFGGAALDQVTPLTMWVERCKA